MNNSQNRNFEEVQGGSNNAQWKPQATEKNGMQFDPDSPNNALEGYYIEERDVKGQQDRYFKVITFRTVNPDGSLNEDVDVIGDTVLADRMSKIPMNSFCRVEYHGRLHKKGYPATSPWSQTNSYHNWKVFIDKNAVPFDQLMGKSHTDHSNAPAFNPNQKQATVQQQQQNQPVFNQNFNQNQPFNTNGNGTGNVQQQQPFQQQQPAFNQGTGHVQQQQVQQQHFNPNQNNQGNPVQQQQFVPQQQQPVFNPNQNNNTGQQQNQGGPNFQNNAGNRNPVGFGQNQGNGIVEFNEDLPF